MDALVLYASLVFARVATFVHVVPLFGSPTVPRLIRIGLALALTAMYLLCLTPALPRDGLLRHSGAAAWLVYGLAVGNEIVLGAALGYAFNLVLAPARIAGEFLTHSVIGLTYGGIVNPAENTSTSALTLVFEGLAILLLFGLDIHHTFFAVLHSTFATYPVGGIIGMPPIQNMVAGLASAQEYGIALAAPVAFCLILTTLILSLLTRAAPPLNIYSIGFPLQLAVGLAAILLFLPNLITALAAALARMAQIAFKLV